MSISQISESTGLTEPPSLGLQVNSRRSTSWTGWTIAQLPVYEGWMIDVRPGRVALGGYFQKKIFCMHVRCPNKEVMNIVWRKTAPPRTCSRRKRDLMTNMCRSDWVTLKKNFCSYILSQISNPNATVQWINYNPILIVTLPRNELIIPDVFTYFSQIHCHSSARELKNSKESPRECFQNTFLIACLQCASWSFYILKEQSWTAWQPFLHSNWHFWKMTQTDDSWHQCSAVYDMWCLMRRRI